MKWRSVFLVVCFLSGLLFSVSAEKAHDIPLTSEKMCPGANTWGLIYDEGLGARYWITEDILTYASVYFWSVGADLQRHQPLNTFAFKLGGGYKLFQFGRLGFPAVFEFRVRMHQDEADTTLWAKDLNFPRYNVWSAAFRIGVAPELFITKHFSVTYRLGFEWGHVGSDYEVNVDGTDLQKIGGKEADNGSAYNYFGFFGIGRETGGPDRQEASKMRFLESNLVLTVYF